MVSGRLSADDGAVFLAGLARAADTLRAEGGPGPVEGPRAWDGRGAAQADALVAMAETVLAGGLHPAKGTTRHQGVVHVDAATLTGGEGGGLCHLEDGPALAADTAHRLACDAGILFLLHGPDGAPINASRRTQSVPAALARVLKARDRGCRFPGCTHHRFVDTHHIAHRARGGETTLANLALLCRAHHRLVHDGGYTMHTEPGGALLFYRPDGTPLDTPAHHRGAR